MTITVQNQSEIKATGHRTHGCCKPIMCIDTGEVYTSITDASEKTGYKLNNLSNAVNGKQKTCHGKRFCFISNVTEHLEEIAQSVRAREAKAQAYEAIEREKNALNDAKAAVEKHRNKCTDLQVKLEKEEQLLYEAEQKLAELQASKGLVNDDT